MAQCVPEPCAEQRYPARQHAHVPGQVAFETELRHARFGYGETQPAGN